MSASIAHPTCQLTITPTLLAGANNNVLYSLYSRAQTTHPLAPRWSSASTPVSYTHLTLPTILLV
eukprot:265431-Prorocentrum_minimum.AAC.1